jgi:hypothetical protein
VPANNLDTPIWEAQGKIRRRTSHAAALVGGCLDDDVTDRWQDPLNAPAMRPAVQPLSRRRWPRSIILWLGEQSEILAA